MWEFKDQLACLPTYQLTYFLFCQFRDWPHNGGSRPLCGTGHTTEVPDPCGGNQVKFGRDGTIRLIRFPPSSPPRVIMNDRSPLIADFPPNELSNLVPRSYRVTVTEIYNHLVVKGLGKRLQTYIQLNPTPDNMLRLRKITRDQIDIYTQLRVNI